MENMALVLEKEEGVYLMAHCYWLKIMSDSTLYNRLKDFIECEGKSCSFDPE